MDHLCYFLALSLMLVGPSQAGDQQPLRMPTRDVDISYDLTWPQRSATRERVRWSAREHLERIDGPDKTASILDRNGNEITLLNGASHTFRKLEGTPRQIIEPVDGVALKRDGEFVVAGLRCIDWSWVDDTETRTACLTDDGVLLRLVVDGKTTVEAHSVSYHQQPPELFEVPSDYAPTLAPGGGLD
jgi:hypothetical protein